MGEIIRKFLSGAGSILEMMPPTDQTKIERPDFMRQPDRERIASDWVNVGSDLQRAMDDAAREFIADGSAQ